MMLSRLGGVSRLAGILPSAVATAAPATAAVTPARGMATLKEIRNRLKSVRNIEKITKSMKMVSAAKFARAEKNLRTARVLGSAVQSLFEKTDLAKRPAGNNQLFVVISSDRGLCGAIHSSISKKVKQEVGQSTPDNLKFVIAGDKARTILARTHGKHILMQFAELGKRPPTFDEATLIAQQILASGYKFDSGKILYNHFRTVISYEQRALPLLSFDALAEAPEIVSYELDDDVLQNYQEFTLANTIYYAMLESSASELSARMSAMENASKNAGEMIGKLTLTFNRTRQAVITGELIEIISGASALN
ncbi:ATP synthase subunit gamma [Capsaspora owczarzaki ATCC 30864]|uniref:F-ATPase gamma subunit n=1 Tax=Capsaspora owczarzaki (strain ATCC 30864) TaxID=595528 RepID=A0A0D2WQN6_CAPO3|nr:ATP synthase subunit gamma [Capsaspora owczarzaki ATCC 30864]KJE93308.1 ATP synthase subunit gamma [Capsaspora owczarzaki ATCC 30864]|eukprot:XP_004347939.2 ATP synthase subunit gamma [Capsaspora owczarzaki ATCC 30864]